MRIHAPWHENTFAHRTLQHISPSPKQSTPFWSISASCHCRQSNSSIRIRSAASGLLCFFSVGPTEGPLRYPLASHVVFRGAGPSLTRLPRLGPNEPAHHVSSPSGSSPASMATSVSPSRRRRIFCLILTDDARLGLFGRWPPFPVPTAKLEGWLSAGLLAPRPETASNETPASGSMGGRSVKWAPALVPADAYESR